MKFIMAFVVVAMHTTVGNPMYIKDLAVPFFFLASGFFLFRKLDASRPEGEGACQKKWLSRIARLYLLWTAIYLPFTVYGFVKGGNSFVHSLALSFRNLLFVGENYLSWPLWYLLGMIWAGCIIFLLRKLGVPIWGMLLAGFAALLAGTKLAAWLVLPAAVALFLFAASIKDLGFVSESLSCTLRQSSVVIYLSHMLFAGVLIICGMQKGFALFAITSACALMLAFLMRSSKCEGLVKFLY